MKSSTPSTRGLNRVLDCRRLSHKKRNVTCGLAGTQFLEELSCPSRRAACNHRESRQAGASTTFSSASAPSVEASTSQNSQALSRSTRAPADYLRQQQFDGFVPVWSSPARLGAAFRRLEVSALAAGLFDENMSVISIAFRGLCTCPYDREGRCGKRDQGLPFPRRLAAVVTVIALPRHSGTARGHIMCVNGSG